MMNKVALLVRVRRVSAKALAEKVIRQTVRVFKSVSLSRTIAAVGDAFYRQYGGESYYDGEVLDDAIIVSSWQDPYGVYYKVAYTSNSDGTYTFAEKEDWVKGGYGFIPD